MKATVQGGSEIRTAHPRLHGWPECQATFINSMCLRCSPDTPIKDCASSLNPVQEERLNNGLPRSPKHAKRMLPEVQAAPEATRHANRSSPDIDDSIPDTPVRPAKLPRAASFCAAPADAKPATSLKEALSHVSAAVANNSEPCIQGQWQWEAGSVRSCSTIPGNMVARDGGEDIDIRSLTAKLATTITSTRPHDQPLTLEELARKTISFAKVSVAQFLPAYLVTAWCS